MAESAGRHRGGIGDDSRYDEASGYQQPNRGNRRPPRENGRYDEASGYDEAPANGNGRSRRYDDPPRGSGRTRYEDPSLYGNGRRRYDEPPPYGNGRRRYDQPPPYGNGRTRYDQPPPYGNGHSRPPGHASGYHGARRRSSESSAPSTIEPSGPLSYWPTAVAGLLIAVANLLAVTHLRLQFLGPALGLWFLLVLPAYLIYTSGLWRGTYWAERVAYSLMSVLLVLMVAGLGVNFLLPLLGDQRPLSPVPIVVLGDLINLSLYVYRRRYPGTSGALKRLPRPSQIGSETRWLMAGSALSVALAVAGANRLNNGAGDTVSLVALTCMVVVLALLLLWHSRVGEAVTCGVVYLVSLGLLLMTSLRGWYVTGHDIQTEYLTFQLTATHAHWSMTYLHNNAYYACLSITILPTELLQVAHVAAPYVYKVFFQLLFAFCPVIVYLIARRFCSVPVSIIATIFFIGMPTFSTDMPFINRQEIAFLFVAVAVLAITQRRWGLKVRQGMLFAAGLGIELSHYSTMYFFVGICVIAWIVQFFVLRHLRRTKDENAGEATSWASNIRTVGIGSIGVLVGVMLLWGQVVTQTSSSALKDAADAVGVLVEPNQLDTLQIHNLPFLSTTPNLQTDLNAYHHFTLVLRAVQRERNYVALSAVEQYSTPIANGTPNLPLTAAGRLLGKVGLSASKVNSLIRNAAAKDELLFVAIGFLALLFARRLRRSIGREAFFIGVGSITMLGLILILPNLSIDYSYLRGYQEALIVMAPVLVIGAITLFSPFGRTAALRIAAVLSIAIFISTCGLLPQLLGGYPAQLSLNNSGQYYDIYYEHPQEVAAVSWLSNQPRVLADGVQASFTPNRYAFTSSSDPADAETSITDIYPALIHQSSWVVISDWTMHSKLSTAYYNGNLITYRYPMSFLQDNKNLVFDNGGAEIFK